MNIKAERIEQLIQLVNRNLSLVFAGQLEGVTPLQVRKLQKVDAVIFGHDKFAYEMVHFIQSATDKLVFDRSVFAAWESNFIKGLESLLVECAVIHDDIERDCFISRVYCWFTEKLAERREVPRDVKIGIDDLKASVLKTVGGGPNAAGHTLRAIDHFHPDESLDGRARLMAESAASATNNGNHALHTTNAFNDHALPPLLSQPPHAMKARHPKFGARKVPLYVQHAYPSVLNSAQQPSMSFQRGGSLPKLPGADENYGLIHNRPETAAEKTMNELWLARRQQESFQHKTQQQLALVMDRLALHRARLESDALRRQESETMLKAIQQEAKEKNNNNNNSNNGTNNKLAGDLMAMTDNEDAGNNNNNNTNNKSLKQNRRGMADRLRASMGDSSPLQSPLDAKKRGGIMRSLSPPKKPTELTVSSLAGGVEAQQIPPPSRLAVPKLPSTGRPTNLTHGNSSVGRHTPMRFKLELPPDYLQRQQMYMQLSDDEEEEEEGNEHDNRGSNNKRNSSVNVNNTNHNKPVNALNKGHNNNNNNNGGGNNVKRSGSAPNKGNGGGKQGEILFKHERMDIRDRPVSAVLCKDVAANDNELKIHYRHTNFRRMPLTDAQIAWCEAREAHRKQTSETLARGLAAAINAKGGGKDKKNNKDKDSKNGGKKKDGKNNGKKGGENEGDEEKIKPKYASVEAFMATHFPKFEAENDVGTMAPMRAVQLSEVNDIVDTFATYHLPIKETALKKALVIPMDKPEAVCLEGLREHKEGLMQNPLPPEFWRVCKMKGGKKGGKKKKKK